MGTQQQRSGKREGTKEEKKKIPAKRIRVESVFAWNREFSSIPRLSQFCREPLRFGILPSENLWRQPIFLFLILSSEFKKQKT